MGYKVIRDFSDLEDNSFLYRVGDDYPHGGYIPSKERIAELSGCKNKIGTPLIEKVLSSEMVEEAAETTETEKAPEKHTKTEIMQMNNANLRKLAESVGIEDADEYTGGELKKMLVSHFDL